MFDHYYGTSKHFVEQTLAQGLDVVLEIDWQGAQQVKRLLPDTQGIFILPPERKTLETRLQERGQDDETVIAQRMQQAIDEIAHYVEAEWLVVNDNFDQALKHLQCILTAQRLRLSVQQHQQQQSLLADLLS